jgi:hypothetical protein
MSIYVKLGGKTVAELPVPATNLVLTNGVTSIGVTWNNNNTITGTTNIIQRWDGTMWIDSGTYPSTATSGTTTGTTPTVGNYNIRVSVKLADKYYPSLVSTGAIIENPYPLAGLVARWQFEDTLDDSSGNAYTLLSNATPVYDTGKVGKGIKRNYPHTSFYATDANILNVIKNTNQFTISYWAKANTASAYEIFGGLNSSAFSGIFFNSGGIAYVDRSGNGQWTNFTTFTNNVWQHYVLTFSGTQTKIYRDGNSTPIYTKNETASISTTKFLVCDDRDNLIYFDQLYLYNRVLSTAEISKLYNSGNGI